MVGAGGSSRGVRPAATLIYEPVRRAQSRGNLLFLLAAGALWAPLIWKMQTDWATNPHYSFGKVIKTIFLCRYIGSEALRREIHAGLNVVENWNGAHSFIFFGKGGEVASNRLEDQELSVLALHLLQRGSQE